jgi:chromosome segregation ATPase
MELLKRYRDIYALDADANQTPHGNSVVNFPAPQAPQQSDNAATPLNLVAEAAAAIRGLEEQAGEAIIRARHIADALMRKLESADARVEDTEKKLRDAEDEIYHLNAAAVETDNVLSLLRQELDAKETELAAAERRAASAEAAILGVIDAIRTHLPLAQRR